MTNNVVVSRITLFSAKMDKTAEFYKTIGLNLEKSIHGWGPLYSYLDILENGTQEIVFEIYPLNSEKAISPHSLGFDVENLPQVIKRLMETGAPLIRPQILRKNLGLSDKCTIAIFEDPDGRTVTITQHGKVKPA